MRALQSRRSAWPVYAVLAIASCTMIGVMLYVLQKGNELNRRHVPLVDAAMAIKLEATAAHLWFEEILGGDRDESMDDVWGHLRQADWYARAMLEGAQLPEGLFLEAEDPELREAVGNVRSKLEEFTTATATRYDAAQTSPTGAAFDPQYDAVFRDLIALADDVEMRVKRIIADETDAFVRTQWLLVGGSLLVWAGVGFVLRRYVVQRTQAERALREAEGRQRTLLENLPLNIFYKNTESVYISCNESYARDLGIAPDEIAGKTDLAFYPHELAEKYRADDQRILASEQTEELDEQYVRDGEPRIIRTTKTPVRDSTGRVIGILGIFRDITERKRAEEALRESEATLSSIFRAAPIGIGMVCNRILKQANDRLCEMVGYAREELLENSSRILYPSQEDFEYVGQEKYRQISEKGTGTVETRWKCKDGRIIDVLLSSTPLDPEDFSAGVTFTALDITERKRAEEEVQSAHRLLLKHEQEEKQHVADELAKARDRLVRHTRLAAIGQVSASIAHELRNPMGVIRNAAFYLKRKVSRQESKVQQYLEVIERETARAERIINDLVAASRGQAPKLTEVALGDLIDSARNHLSPPETIRWQYGDHVPKLTICADAAQFEQVFRNLFSNSIQAMQGAGTITIEGTSSDDSNEIIVSDTGPGIPRQRRDEIFEPLVTGQSKGTGLGLTICREIIKCHDGTIEAVDSDQGATFRIRLPRSAENGKP